ncbi:ABC transporter ATP-binding protein [Corynebacterium lizhenjunii]|uniref:ABC transporter ATP-binding protein n=1 Tax=Corynebacterium lizhenjunii TaxID=2709394 RepID=A0A7T0PAI4_9CORY|nr:ABC transporter ATP-binding protein [Corynebacterium lizhenjunii]QPK79081.1 ABC transporter ATP-binding protein [Corynebacterium lizhenjunii]
MTAEGTSLNSAAATPAGNTPAAPAVDSGLVLHDITVRYPDGNRTLTALDGANVRVAPGEVVALTGESGSGKSTLLSVAGGLIVPDAGRVVVAGQDIATAPDRVRTQVRREHIGLVFQQPNLLAALRVRDQLLLMDHLQGKRATAKRARRADELLERVGLGGLGQRRIGELSGGQRQRVNIARALMSAPTVLLADEPTSALDSARSADIMTLLQELTHEFDIATLLVTHSQTLAQRADAQVRVVDGRVTAVVGAA